MVVLFLVGCAVERDDDPFFNTSDRYDPPDWTSSDTAGDDTGDTAGGGDAGAPVLSDVSLTWEEFPNVGMVLLFQATYADEGDDIVGGTCFIDVYNDGEFVSDFTLDITDAPEGDDGQCVAVDGQFYFAIEDLDDSKSGGVTVEVKDGSGNVSETYEATTEE